MSEAASVPAAEAPAPSASAPSDGRVGLGHVLLIAVACSAISGVAAWKLAVNDAIRQPRLVAVDYARLASLQVEHAAKAAGSREEAVRMAESFAQTLNSVTKDYADRGYWIIDSERMLAVPYGNDITDEIAERLRVTGGK